MKYYNTHKDILQNLEVEITSKPQVFVLYGEVAQLIEHPKETLLVVALCLGRRVDDSKLVIRKVRGLSPLIADRKSRLNTEQRGVQMLTPTTSKEGRLTGAKKQRPYSKGCYHWFSTPSHVAHLARVKEQSSDIENLDENWSVKPAFYKSRLYRGGIKMHSLECASPVFSFHATSINKSYKVLAMSGNNILAHRGINVRLRQEKA